jgi:hypothetical protein
VRSPTDQRHRASQPAEGTARGSAPSRTNPGAGRSWRHGMYAAEAAPDRRANEVRCWHESLEPSATTSGQQCTSRKEATRRHRRTPEQAEAGGTVVRRSGRARPKAESSRRCWPANKLELTAQGRQQRCETREETRGRRRDPQITTVRQKGQDHHTEDAPRVRTTRPGRSSPQRPTNDYGITRGAGDSFSSAVPSRVTRHVPGTDRRSTLKRTRWCADY